MAHEHGPDHSPGHDEHAHDDAHEDHVVPLSTYFWVFMGLMVLLVITLVAAYFDLGALNLPIAMAIAVAKMMIVVLFFMHVKWSSGLVKTFAGATMMWLVIMFLFTLTDYISRGWTQAGR